MEEKIIKSQVVRYDGQWAILATYKTQDGAFRDFVRNAEGEVRTFHYKAKAKRLFSNTENPLAEFAQ